MVMWYIRTVHENGRGKERKDGGVGGHAPSPPGAPTSSDTFVVAAILVVDMVKTPHTPAGMKRGKKVTTDAPIAVLSGVAYRVGCAMSGRGLHSGMSNAISLMVNV